MVTELDRLKKILRQHNTEFCTSCRHEIGFGDIAWNEGQTEAGTPTSWIQIQCLSCQKEIAWISSWTWFNEDEDRQVETILGILEKDWKK